MTTKATSPKKALKKERNIAEAAARLERLQALQRDAKLARSHGFVGTDKHVVAQYRAAEALKKSEDAYMAEQQYITDSLNGPSGQILTRWLAGRKPIYKLVKRFFDERPAQMRVRQIYIAPPMTARQKLASSIREQFGLKGDDDSVIAAFEYKQALPKAA